MMKTTELNRLIAESGKSKEKIASILGISLGSLNNKLANRTEFKASEMEILWKILDLDRNQIFDIFFAPEVSCYDTLGEAVDG